MSHFFVPQPRWPLGESAGTQAEGDPAAAAAGSPPHGRSYLSRRLGEGTGMPRLRRALVALAAVTLVVMTAPAALARSAAVAGAPGPGGPLGALLDRWLHATWISIVGLILGTVAGLIELIRTVSKDTK